jgi:hypothetical protein
MFLDDVCARLSGSTYHRVIALINWYEKENDERRGTNGASIILSFKLTKATFQG